MEEEKGALALLEGELKSRRRTAARGTVGMSRGWPDTAL